jgi:hypothetical protein
LEGESRKPNFIRGNLNEIFVRGNAEVAYIAGGKHHFTQINKLATLPPKKTTFLMKLG